MTDEEEHAVISQLNDELERQRAMTRNAQEVAVKALAECSDLRTRLLTAAGDDLCRLTQEEIKAYTSGEVLIPPKSEFLPSCEKFWEQTANKAGVLKNCMTLAQLVAENERLNADLRVCRDVYGEVYPSVAGRAMQLEAAGECVAAEQWCHYASLLMQAMGEKK